LEQGLEYTLPLLHHTKMEVLQNLLSKDSETLAEVAQRSGRCPVSGNIQGQVGWGYGQPDGVEDVPADCGGGWAR